MKYPELRVIRFNSQLKFEAEYNKRYNDYSTIHTDLYIYPFGKYTRITNKRHQLFVVNNSELIMLQERIMTKAIEINRLLVDLPKAAQHSFVRSVLVDEIQSTNEIEGVNSSRKEIARALHEMNRNSRSKSRFAGLVKLYFYLQTNDSFAPIKDCQEIRRIYDELVADEVDERNKLDGNLFRKESVEIKQGENVVHRGNPNEDSIIEDLNHYIAFINNLDIPYLIRAMLGHYFFEYIHPFYDGNGRTGRYITCKYLSERLDILTTLSFSHIINDRKDSYYKAFKVTSEEYNMGEGTMFVYEMLKIMEKGQLDLVSNLENSRLLLEKARIYVEKALSDEDKKKYQVLYLICQSTLFRGELTDGEIASYLTSHRSTVDKRLKDLEKMGMIEKIQSKPSIHILTEKAIKSIHEQELPKD